MKKGMTKTLAVFVAAVMIVVVGAGAASAYTTGGNHIGKDVWYKTTNSFTDETRAGARQAMSSWNAYLPVGKRVCYDSSYVSEALYPNRNFCNSITKISSTKSYLGQNTWWADPDDAVVVESDININARYSWWNNPPAGYYDPYSTLLHEFGHTVGLGHSTETTAVMYKSLSSGTTKRTLRADDINGVKSLY